MQIVHAPPAAAWDEFLAVTPGGTIFQSVAWSELRSLAGWPVRRLAVTDGAGEILAAAAVGCRRLLRGARAVLYAQRGPVFRPGAASALDHLLAALAAEARQLGVAFVKLNPDLPAGHGPLVELLTEHGYRRVMGSAYAHTTTRRIDLTPGLEAVRAGMEARTRRAIDKARRDGVAITSGIEPQRAEAFARLLQDAARRQGFAAPPRRFLLACIARLGPSGQCRVFEAELGGAHLASAVALAFGHRATYMWGAMDAEAKTHRTNPSELLQWEIMRWANERGCTEYDLQGAPEDAEKGDPLWGIYMFKRGLGGRVVRLAGEFDQVHDPITYRAWTLVEPAYLWWKTRQRAA